MFGADRDRMEGPIESAGKEVLSINNHFSSSVLSFTVGWHY